MKQFIYTLEQQRAAGELLAAKIARELATQPDKSPATPDPVLDESDWEQDRR